MVKKVLFGLLCVVLAGLLGFGILQSKREDQARAQALSEINEQLEPLRSRKLELEAELAGLKRENEEEMSGMATLSLLVTDLDADLATQIVPALQEADVPAVLVLSQTQFPGDEGCITVEDLQQRLEDGWDYCVAWDGSDSFDEWYPDMSRRLEDIGLAMPKALYCEGKSYSADLAKAAQARGITTIVHNGEQDQPIVSVEFEDLWKMGSVRWIASGGRNLLEQAVEKHGSTVFRVDQIDFYESEFAAMLKLLNQYRDEDALMTGTLAESRAYREKLAAEQEEMRDEAYEAKVRELNEKIQAVEDEIQALMGK